MRKNPGRSRNRPINEKQELFCREFLVDHNGTQAAQRAGYSKPSAHSQASYLLRQPKIKRRIEELKAEQRERVTLRADLTLERLMNELSKIAFADIGKVVRWGTRTEVVNGKQVVREYAELIPSEELDEDTRLAVKKLWKGKDGQVQVEMFDKRQALTDLGQHFGMRLGGKTQIGIGIASGKALPKPDFSNVSNEQLAKLEEMLLAIEAGQTEGAAEPSSAIIDQEP
jgi:phage terminase small subunit